MYKKVALFSLWHAFYFTYAKKQKEKIVLGHAPMSSLHQHQDNGKGIVHVYVQSKRRSYVCF